MWHAVADSIVPFELRPEDRNGFRCEIRTGEVGMLRVVDISAPTSEAVRDARLIRRSDPGMCSVHLQVRGDPVVEQDDRQVRLAPGDLALLDLSRPTRVAGDAHRQISVVFPRVLLPLPPRDVRNLAGVRLSGRHGAGALVASLVRQIASDLDGYAGAGAARIGSAVLDLTTATLAAWTGHPAPARQEVLVRRIERFIDQRLGDVNLTPGMVAAAHHISLRYLYRLFEAREASIAALIRTRRLERCRQDLASPALVHIPVHAIGARWGFLDPARFNRVFRTEHGVPPGEYRRRWAN
jgi:AraC-like DNA-binding protein